jgi:hypothetical protein
MPGFSIEKNENAHEAGLEISDVKLLSTELAEASPFAQAGFKADNWKAYVQFKLNHSMPVVAGPLASGNFTAYHPGVLARSFQSLLHQQMNLRHLVRSYNPKVVAKDRIVGAVVGVSFPQQSAMQMPKTKDAALPITAVAAIFKQADGVPKMLGDHLASRQEWSVSMETVFPIAECGIYLASDGSITPLMEAPEKMWAGISRGKNGIRVGRMGGKDHGEQMIVAPGGIGGSIEYQGVGFTPTPAEREAVIEEVHAERATLLAEGVMAIAAEAVPLAMFPRGVRWLDALNNLAVARVMAVHQEGEAKLGRDRRTATPENPVLHCRIRGTGQEVLRSLRSVLIP